jgi:hypothetical protein
MGFILEMKKQILNEKKWNSIGKDNSDLEADNDPSDDSDTRNVKKDHTKIK